MVGATPPSEVRLDYAGIRTYVPVTPKAPAVVPPEFRTPLPAGRIALPDPPPVRVPNGGFSVGAKVDLKA